jgi:hypothetical protein
MCACYAGYPAAGAVIVLAPKTVIGVFWKVWPREPAWNLVFECEIITSFPPGAGNFWDGLMTELEGS